MPFLKCVFKDLLTNLNVRFWFFSKRDSWKPPTYQTKLISFEKNCHILRRSLRPSLTVEKTIFTNACNLWICFWKYTLLIIFSIQIWYFYFFYYYFECPSHFTDIHLFRPSLTIETNNLCKCMQFTNPFLKGYAAHHISVQIWYYYYCFHWSFETIISVNTCNL